MPIRLLRCNRSTLLLLMLSTVCSNTCGLAPGGLKIDPVLPPFRNVWASLGYTYVLLSCLAGFGNTSLSWG